MSMANLLHSLAWTTQGEGERMMNYKYSQIYINIFCIGYAYIPHEGCLRELTVDFWYSKVTDLIKTISCFYNVQSLRRM